MYILRISKTNLSSWTAKLKDHEIQYLHIISNTPFLREAYKRDLIEVSRMWWKAEAPSLGGEQM
jgi:hypothetical protein